VAKFQRAQGSYSLLPSTPPSGELEGDGARGSEQAAPRTHTLAVCTFFFVLFLLVAMCLLSCCNR